MSASGSFGFNPLKSYGTDPSVVPAKLGDVASNKDGWWIFIQAEGALAQYAWCWVDETGNTDELTTSNAEVLVAVPQVALADNEYGWAWIGGPAGGLSGTIKGKFAASYVAFAAVYTTATDGVADDSATTLIKNVTGITTDSGSGSSIVLLSSGFLGTK